MELLLRDTQTYLTDRAPNFKPPGLAWEGCLRFWFNGLVTSVNDVSSTRQANSVQTPSVKSNHDLRIQLERPTLQLGPNISTPFILGSGSLASILIRFDRNGKKRSDAALGEFLYPRSCRVSSNSGILSYWMSVLGIGCWHVLIKYLHHTGERWCNPNTGRS